MEEGIDPSIVLLFTSLDITWNIQIIYNIIN